jgi:hypothetical protein
VDSEGRVMLQVKLRRDVDYLALPLESVSLN